MPTMPTVLLINFLSSLEPELIEELCTPNIGDRKRLKYKTLSQRSVFQRPSGNINHPDNFDVLRRCSSSASLTL